MPRTSQGIRAARPMKFKPTMRFEGKDAKALMGMKPGKKISAMVHGRMLSSGVDAYDPKRTPYATMEIHSTMMAKGMK